MPWALLLLWFAVVPAVAQPAARATAAEVEAGRKLVEKDCVTCHVSKFGAAATIYQRSERKVRSPAQLIAQVRYCNVELGTNYFPEDEEHVAAYLNLQYYKFAP